MKCPKCGEENSDSSKFCKNCGESMEPTIVEAEPRTNNGNHKKIIIALIAIIAILVISIGVIASGILTPTTYETQSFEGFKIDVPAGQEYVLSDSFSSNPKNVFFAYLNKDKYYFDGWGFQVGNNLTSKVIFGELQYKDGDVEIYKNESTDLTLYLAYKHAENGSVLVYGSNEDMIKHMAHSFKSEDLSKLATGNTQSTGSSQTTSSASSSTPKSISILGGSFSTGSADEDKTYARINVGTAHAGEDVIVQIWYERDGNTLNNGNMVPASVHSDGYLEIASADAYLYYPDHATINIYDSNSNLLATQSVSLSPQAGTQTF